MLEARLREALLPRAGEPRARRCGPERARRNRPRAARHGRRAPWRRRSAPARRRWPPVADCAPNRDWRGARPPMSGFCLDLRLKDFPVPRAPILRYRSLPLAEPRLSCFQHRPEDRICISSATVIAAAAVAAVAGGASATGHGGQDRPRRPRCPAPGPLRQGQRKRRAHGHRGPERQGRRRSAARRSSSNWSPKTTPPIRSRAPPPPRSCATPRSTAWSAT